MATTVVVRANSQQQAIAQAQRFAGDLARANERIAQLEAENAALPALNPDAAKAIPTVDSGAYASSTVSQAVAVAPNGRAPAIPFGQEIVTATGNKVQLMPAVPRGFAGPQAPAAQAPTMHEFTAKDGSKVRLLPGPNGQQ